LRAKTEPLIGQEQLANRRVSATTLTVSRAPHTLDHEKKEEHLSMRKAVFRGATEESTHMADPPAYPGAPAGGSDEQAA